MFQYLIDRFKGTVPKGFKRSPKWSTFRKEFIKDKKCSVCGATTKLEAHHIIPFYILPELELDPNNLMVLCRNKKFGVNCHLFIGHIGDFRKYNRTVKKDAAYWTSRLRETQVLDPDFFVNYKG